MLTAAEALETLRRMGCGALADAIPLEVAEAVLAAPQTYKEQPLKALLEGASASRNPHGHRVLRNTNSAIEVLSRSGGAAGPLDGWLSGQVRSAADLGDYANAASALAEIRALGAVSATGAQVAPVRPSSSRRTSDFRLAEGADEWLMEVHAKQMNRAEAEALARFHRGVDGGHERQRKSRNVTIREHVVHPAGQPRPGETVAENVASKFANIKSDAGQAAGDRPSVLWLDLQSDEWWFLDVSCAEPVSLSNGEFTSLGIWHGVYGLRGTPLFEANSLEQRVVDVVQGMRFDGLFKHARAWSAAVLAFTDGVVLFENPSAANPLANEMRERLLGLYGLDWGRSWIDWPAGSRSLGDRVIDERTRLEALARRARFSW